MKRILKRLLIVILILIILSNFVVTRSVYALDAIGEGLGGLFSGVIGFLTIIYRVPVVMIGWLINAFMASLAFAENTGETPPVILTPFDILFNKVKILDINFFDITDGDDSLVGQFRVNIAAWFYIMRNVSAAILLIILIYIGIRMALSTIASDRAIYKRMLVDWTASLGLIFILSYIIIFTIEVNNAIVNALASGSGTELTSTMDAFASRGMAVFGGIPSIVAAIIFIVLIWQTATLFFSYFNRMLKIAFLIIIAPLISLTYSIDKIGDGKAQALEAWLKEFVFTILMQPFHCAIYLSLISTAFDVLTGLGSFSKISETLGAGILAIVCVTFTKEAEKIIRKIFAFKDDNKSTSLVAGAAVASMALSKAKNVGTGTAKVVNGAKGVLAGASMSNAWMNFKADAIASKRYLSGENSDKDGNAKKDYTDIRSEVKAELYNKKAEEWEKKYMHAKTAEGESKKFATESQRVQDYNEERARLSAESGGTMSDKELDAFARFNVAKKGRDANSKMLHVRAKRAITGVNKGANIAKTKVAQFVNAINPLEETTKFLAKEGMQGAIGIVAGAGTLGTNGSVSASLAAGVAAGKVAEQYSKASKSSYKRELNDLAAQHSSITPNGNADKEEARRSAVKGKTTKLFNKVASNAADYNLDGDVPEKLKSIIAELQEAAKEIGCEKPEETDIVNTIKQNKTNPIKGKNGLESFYQNIGGTSNNQNIDPEKLSRFERAKGALNDYSIEYAISNTYAEADKMSVSQTVLIKEMESDTQALYLKENKKQREEKVKNLEIAKKIIESPDITEEVTTIVEDMSVDEIDSLYETLGTVIVSGNKGNRINVDGPLSEMQKKLEEKQSELERKRVLLIGEAVRRIDNANEQRVTELCEKVSREVNRILNQTQEFENKEELEKLKDDMKKKLEEIRNQK